MRSGLAITDFLNENGRREGIPDWLSDIPGRGLGGLSDSDCGRLSDLAATVAGTCCKKKSLVHTKDRFSTQNTGFPAISARVH